MSGSHGSSAPAFFVVGCGRSGTTLLRAMLASHGEISIPPESYFTVDMLRREQDLTGADGRLRTELAAAWLRRRRSVDEWGIDVGELEDRWRATRPDVPTALRDLYRAYGDVHGSAVVADKTPVHGRHVERLAQAFPDARFLHVVRDGRDVAASLVGMPFAPDRYGGALLYWHREVVRARDGGSRVGPGRYEEVRYEQLVADPRQALGAVCEFVDVPFDPAMLSHTTNADELLSGIDRTSHLQGIRRPVTAGLRDWRRDLTTHDQELAEALVGGLLAELDYEAGPTPGPVARAHAATWRASTRAGRHVAAARARLRRVLGRGAAHEPLPRRHGVAEGGA